MGTATTMVTVQEFLAQAESDEQRQELIGGEVVSMGPAGFGHEWIKGNLILILAAWVIKNPSMVFPSETMAQLTDYDSPIPGVSMVSRGRKPTDMKPLFQGAPDLAIKVVRIYDDSDQARMFDRTQNLENPAELPGFSAPVSAIFEGI